LSRSSLTEDVVRLVLTEVANQNRRRASRPALLLRASWTLLVSIAVVAACAAVPVGAELPLSPAYMLRTAEQSEQPLDILYDLVRQHPSSPEASEALWRIADIWQAKQQLPYAAWAWQTLLARYPCSPHADTALQSYRTWLAKRKADADESDACVECVNLLHPDYVSLLDIYLKCKSNPAGQYAADAWRQTRQQCCDHLTAIPEYKLPPFDYWDPVTNAPGKDHYDPQVQDWWVIGRGEEARRRSVVEQRRQVGNLYVASLDIAVTQILKAQCSRPTRDLLLEELNHVWLMENDERIRNYAMKKLDEVEAVIVAEYMDQAKKALLENRLEDAKVAYRYIVENHPGTEYARVAEAEIRKIVPVLVSVYRKRGDENFKPERNFGVPQSKAREYYERMYLENPEGPMADYALYHWSRALGTEGNLQQEISELQDFVVTFPQSVYLPKAMYLLGFAYGSQSVKDYSSAIDMMRRVADQFPECSEAPEALWHAAFYCAWNNRFQDALPLLQRLYEKYPSSPRSKWVTQWTARFQEKIKSGGTWP